MFGCQFVTHYLCSVPEFEDCKPQIIGNAPRVERVH
jgi:hypothetical protein